MDDASATSVTLTSPSTGAISSGPMPCGLRVSHRAQAGFDGRPPVPKGRHIHFIASTFGGNAFGPDVLAFTPSPAPEGAPAGDELIGLHAEALQQRTYSRPSGVLFSRSNTRCWPCRKPPPARTIGRFLQLWLDALPIGAAEQDRGPVEQRAASLRPAVELGRGRRRSPPSASSG